MELNKKSKIFIAGHNGMVGKSILNVFKKKKNIRISALQIEKNQIFSTKKKQ